MGFVTDFIWRSPLGLRINAQATADVQMTEDWVRIRGDQLTRPQRPVRSVDHRGAVGDAFLRSRLAARRRSPGRHGDVRGRAIRGTAAAARRDRDRAGAGTSCRRATIRAATCATWCAPATIAISTSPDAARIRASRASTTSSSSCPSMRRAPVRCGWSRTGWVHPTDSSVNVALGQGNHRAAGRPVAARRRRRGAVQARARPGSGFPPARTRPS